MEKIETAVQKAFDKYPTRLEVLRELLKREGLEQDKNLREDYLRLEKGAEGEQDLVNYLEKYGEAHWVILRNVWLDFYGEFEIDLLLITRGGLYSFEVKNYSGNLELIDSQCRMNGHSIGQNPFSQAQKVPVQLKEMFKHQSRHPEIQGVLVFIGENNHVTIQDQVSGIQVLCRNELMHYIWQIARQERNYLGYPVEVDTVLAALRSYEIGKPSKEKEIPQTAKEYLRKGVCCCYCGSFDVKAKNGYVICSCGMHEPKTEAILRTICEYGIIYHEKNLTTTGLTDFFDGFITRKTISRYLNKYFERVGSYKGAEYLNKKKSIADVCQNFDLKESKYLKIR
ncbi:Nuclease-related domain-containing protein [Atopostipes suicloacalis DSM 15692]|uniref:Nuclease-related domain-containing protein n=1 Tax=Atopostipes suicloacalis DSM 15692 TaxID=1121025 RepID=A0A1M4SJ67_9LACT|nr:nuclease-related domain-containing protein [Atopostipes suicloacalis]SHE32229.1 Nuclease-related domain-containing protein [Atopostipes suicloacalis DSM 15692]